ncbi:MAG: M20/M25/M40 family metallo-hydrolase [Actinobacteria bacterium]|nr:M20/M25/M40 family metallo-hydrolase [Actinomycetota bacterium]
MSIVRKLSPIVGALAMGCTMAMQVGPTGPTSAAITAADLRTRLYAFADDSMIGRQFGTEGNLMGTQYIAQALARIGIQPGGENGSYFQNVPAWRISLAPGAQVSLGAIPLSLGSDYVTSFPSTGRALPLDSVQVIYGGDLSDTTALISPDQAAGKAVLFTSRAPIGRGAFRLLARFSGAATLITTGDPASARLSVTTSTDTAPSRINLVVTPTVASRILGADIASVQPGAAGQYLRFSSIAFNRTTAPARNVIGIIPGTDAALRGEYVAIGAHNDHLGVRFAGPLDHDSLRAFNTMAQRIVEARTHQTPGSPGSGLTAADRASMHINVDSLHRVRPARMDSIYNGADDDGSGSVGTLEIAEAFATSGIKPRRSLIFVWHTGEEAGLLGSRYFTDNPTVPRDSIVAQLNIDMIGRGGAVDFLGGGPLYLQLVGSRRLSTELGDIVEAVNRTEAQPLSFDYAFDANGHPERIYCRSDHYEYARYGIPITFFTTGLHMDYHQLTDEPQYIDYEHMRKVAQLVHDVALRVGNLDHRIVVDKAKPDPRGACVQ